MPGHRGTGGAESRRTAGYRTKLEAEASARLRLLARSLRNKAKRSDYTLRAARLKSWASRLGTRFGQARAENSEGGEDDWQVLCEGAEE